MSDQQPALNCSGPTRRSGSGRCDGSSKRLGVNLRQSASPWRLEALQQIKACKKPQIAGRAIDYKWFRIIHFYRKDRVPYNGVQYIQRFKNTGSPLAKLISRIDQDEDEF
jgi:hypothetical protein